MTLPAPSPVPTSQLLQALNWRYATKRFDPARKIPDQTWNALEQALLLAPSSYGLQPWRFVVVQDKPTREKLREASWNQPQIVEASHLVVLARRTSMARADVDRYLERIAAVRSVPRESLADFARMMLSTIESPPPGMDLAVWTSRQVYIALGFFLSACAMLGVDACPMEGIEPARYDQILGLPAQGFNACVVATAGYRSAQDPVAALQKVRFPVEDVVRRV